MLPEATKQAIMRHRRLFAGEPCIFGLPYLAENEFLSDLGLDLERVLGMNSAEAVTNYLTRADGSIFAFLPATKLQAYLILEALVPI
jgi:siroheme synthase